MDGELLMKYAVTRPFLMLVLTPLVAELAQMVYNHLKAEGKAKAADGMTKRFYGYLGFIFCALSVLHFVGFARHGFHWIVAGGLAFQASFLSVALIGLYARIRKVVPSCWYASFVVVAFYLVAQLSGAEGWLLEWLKGFNH